MDKLGVTKVPVLYGYSVGMRFLGVEEISLAQIHYIIQGHLLYSVVDLSLWQRHVAKLNGIEIAKVTFAMMATAFTEAHVKDGPTITQFVVKGGSRMWIPAGVFVARRAVQATDRHPPYRTTPATHRPRSVLIPETSLASLITSRLLFP